ncbi:DUF72 domain-containing protein [Mucilaginibacter ginkgonis]|uniref:DUF72 domain-containing protein n=1 Tax=Mucilaginibacter ginkgonis TaxID=2682091 RepID=A0A6I4HZH3_9SPHI|nr:DUF72 domain-containing protein [Mucilaginibacter ginkgonis]QQL48669.1 DUF72 domain-containing protein [Mucilaginibacter ginkgonis]
MEFGKVADADKLPQSYFNLPPDTAFTAHVLANASGSGKFQAHVGCAKWGRKEWVGQIYPPKTKEANFLTEYVKHFDSIELNATFYQVYGPETLSKWAEKAEGNPNFKFCPKFSQSISHIRRLKNAEEITTQFYNGVLAFGDKLGPMFLQLSDNFTPKSFPELKAYLEHLPTDVPVFVEVRHKEWFNTAGTDKDIFALLRDLNIGSVITDASGRRDCGHMNLSTPHAFIRYVGNGLLPTDYGRIDEWVDRIKKWKDEGLQSLWFFMHQHDEQYSPVLADYTIEKLNEALGTSIQRPQFLPKQESMELK